jgi:CIC family chloride channel protein
MHKRDESIPVSPLLSPIRGRERLKVSGKVDKRVLYLSLQAIFNALVIGFIAKALVYLIDFITNLAFYGKVSFAPASPAHNHLGVFVVAVPIIGSLIVGVMARYGSKAIRGHGIPEAMEKIILDESRIPPLITLLKPISAAISIGTGGPFGAEGPIIATGGAFGSFTGQIMHISPAERKIILSAGACAGMSAIFGSPLAAVLLAVELLLFEFSARSIIPVALACVTGAAMHLWLFGGGPAFPMPHLPEAPVSALAIYVGVGIAIGVIAALVSKSVYMVEDLFEKLPIHWMWWPAMGAVAVGVVGYFAPFTLGVGYENIQHLLSGTAPLALLLSLFFLKYLSWVISLGSGTSGGTLAPLLTIGGALGALLGVGLLRIFPDAGVTVAMAALVGMAAMFAGASRALLTSIIFALETTGQSNALLPLLATCIAAYFVSFFMMEGSIMTEKINRRGVATPDNYEADLLQLSTAGALMVPVPEGLSALPAVAENDSLSICVQLMGKTNVTALFVADKDDIREVKGVIYARDILKHYSEQKLAEGLYDSPARTRRWMVRTRRIVRPGR